MKWTLKALGYNLLKNLLDSNRYRDKFNKAICPNIHPSAIVGGYIDTVYPERIHIEKNVVVSNAARIIVHGPGVKTQKLVIGEGAFIGTGAIVMKSVPPGLLIKAGSVWV